MRQERERVSKKEGASEYPPKASSSWLFRRRLRLGDSGVRRDIGYLLLPHAVVQPALAHELLVRALLHDLPFPQHDDKVCIDS